MREAISPFSQYVLIAWCVVTHRNLLRSLLFLTVQETKNASAVCDVHILFKLLILMKSFFFQVSVDAGEVAGNFVKRWSMRNSEVRQ
jgi:hypothetical protein